MRRFVRALIGVTVLLTASLASAQDGAGTAPNPAGTPSPAVSPPVVRVAVYDLARSDIEPRVGTVFTMALMNELRKLDRTSVIGMDEVKAMLDLEAQKQLAGCEADSCLSEIAEALGADIIVTGSLARVGGNTFIALKKIEQRSATVAAQFTRKLDDAGGEEFLAMIGPAVAELFADRPLRAGQVRGVPKSIAARLFPPPLDPWMFWTGMGTTVVGVAATAASGAILADRFFAFDALRNAGTAKGSELLPAKATAEGWAMTTVGLGIGAGIVGLSTGIAWFFVDWGEGDENG